MDKNITINNYDIFLDINTNLLNYKGLLTVNLTLNQNQTELLIDSDVDIIKSVKLNNNNIKWETDKQKKLIIIKNNFEKGEHKITIFFKNKITDVIDGFYYTKKNNSLICCTNLEPISARKFIPCFDTPNLKAKFNLGILIEQQYEAISNSSVNSINTIFCDKNKSVKKKIIFNETPLMSTYLLCLVMGDIKPALSNPIVLSNRVKINGWCIDEDKKYIGWSIHQSLKALDFFEKWFDIKYPLEKLDICAIPNFSSGAMENWGLITFREECILLYNKNNLFSKIKILEVIFHEIAHQWFGNLVTLNEWNDLWLNEATATYFSWMSLEICYNNYEIKELYWLLECKSLYFTDGITGTHSIVIDENKLIEPIELFDEITYSKGNTIIKYIVSLLGLNNFQKAISKYLKENIYQNPSSEKLYSYFNEFRENFSVDYISLMNDLIKTKGYPIIFINLDKEKSNKKKIFIQIKTFNLEKKKLHEFPIDIYIKIKYCNLLNSNKTNELLFEIKSGQVNEINISNKEDDLIFNPNNNLFCIIKYDGIKPKIENLVQSELMKYVNDEFILYLYNYHKFENYFELVVEIFRKLDMIKNNLLFVTILSDLNYLFYLYEYFNSSNYINKFKIKFINIFKNIINTLVCSDNKYIELILDQIFIILVIYFKENQIYLLVKNIYEYQIKIKNYDLFYMHKSLFKIMMFNSQKEIIDDYIKILITTTNVQITTSIIESFCYLNSENFQKIFSNYKNIIKTQDYDLFFCSISKIKEKQELIIDYWIEFKEQISEIDEIKFKILKCICKNIYQNDLIDKLLIYLKKIYKTKYQFIFDKIISILETNKIILDNLDN